MKIISCKKGMVKTCKICGCEAEYYPADTKKEITSSRCGIEKDSCSETNFVVCPYCGSEIILSQKHWVE